ncbi:MAG: clostripain-related cysteine peptidase, partial [bacterium]
MNNIYLNTNERDIRSAKFFAKNALGGDNDTNLIGDDIKSDIKIRDDYNTDNGYIDKKVGDQGKKKNWLVIVYGAGDYDYAEYVAKDFNEVSELSSSESTHLVALFDFGKQWGPIPFENARVYYIGQNSIKELGYLGSVNMANPGFMAKIIKEIIKKFPAENVAILIAGSGMGWKGSILEEDKVQGRKERMKITQVRRALEIVRDSIGKKIDVLAFDGSFMAMFEVGYELKDVVKYMVASQTHTGKGRINYKAALSGWYEISSKADPKELAKMLVENVDGYDSITTLSAVDLEKAADVAKAINSFAETVLKANNSDMRAVKKKIQETQKLSDAEISYKDLKHFMELVAEDNKINIEIREKAKAVIKALDDYKVLVYSSVKNFPHAKGVGIELPYTSGDLYKMDSVVGGTYQVTSFAQDVSLWVK